MKIFNKLNFVAVNISEKAISINYIVNHTLKVEGVTRKPSE